MSERESEREEGGSEGGERKGGRERERERGREQKHCKLCTRGTSSQAISMQGRSVGLSNEEFLVAYQHVDIMSTIRYPLHH